ncbi:MBL fold metallo-hydrolase [Porticoccus sp.]
MANTSPLYPFPKPPELGEPQKVAEGVYWLRMPLPFRLDHINLWLLEEDDGWTIVDTGLASDDTAELWLKLCPLLSDSKPIKRLIATHMHPDHIGLAAWLCRHSGAEFWMSRGEYMHCRILLEDSAREAPEEAIDFYQAAGFSAEQLNYYRSRFGGFGSMIRGMPSIYHRLREGQTFSINGRAWHIVMGEGHSPEHACLHCPELGVLISGDQLLPTISSNVSVWPIEPAGNPLQDWIDSCHKLQALIPQDTLVLPSHGLPFRGALPRLQSLIEQHEKDLQIVLENCGEPQRVVDLFPLIFKSPIGNSMLVLATGESYAHLHCLIARGQLRVEKDTDGVNWYRRV